MSVARRCWWGWRATACCAAAGDQAQAFCGPRNSARRRQQAESDRTATGHGKITLEHYSFMLKVAGQTEVVEYILTPQFHGFQKRAWRLRSMHRDRRRMACKPMHFEVRPGSCISPPRSHSEETEEECKASRA